jgi:Ca2+-transporting ATPase
MIAPLAKIFQVVPLTVKQWAITLFLSFMPIIVIEIQKLFNKKSMKAKKAAIFSEQL